jgi:hypothetical protein
LTKYICAVLFLVGFSLNAAFAMEITPNIGFRQHAAPNGGEYNISSPYRAQMRNGQYAMNDQVLRDVPLGKIVPDFNSVGLDFTFKVE